MKHSPFALLAAGCAGALLSCSAAGGPASHPNPVKAALEAQLDIARKAPLVARWNPAPCACPAFEVQLGQQWVRAEMYMADGERFLSWLEFLGGTAMEALPVPVELEGRIDRDLLRTNTGNYAVRVEVTAILSPIVPELAPPAVVEEPDSAAR